MASKEPAFAEHVFGDVVEVFPEVGLGDVGREDLEIAEHCRAVGLALLFLGPLLLVDQVHQQVFLHLDILLCFGRSHCF